MSAGQDKEKQLPFPTVGREVETAIKDLYPCSNNFPEGFRGQDGLFYSFSFRHFPRGGAVRPGDQVDGRYQIMATEAVLMRARKATTKEVAQSLAETEGLLAEVFWGYNVKDLFTQRAPYIIDSYEMHGVGGISYATRSTNSAKALIGEQKMRALLKGLGVPPAQKY